MWIEKIRNENELLEFLSVWVERANKLREISKDESLPFMKGFKAYKLWYSMDKRVDECIEEFNNTKLV